MLRQLALALFVLVTTAVPPAKAYDPSPSQGETRPYDAHLPDSVTVRIPEAGLSFVADQLESGLQANTLRRAIVEALEGQYFELVLPIFGGNLRLTIPCGTTNSHLDDPYFDNNYKKERAWCPYTRGPVTRSGQVSLGPVTTGTDDGFRYERVELQASTYPPAEITLPEPDSLFAALYLLDDNGRRAQLDMVPEHPLFVVQVPALVTEPTTGLPKIPFEFEYQCFHLLASGAGCSSTFVATLEADLVTGGQLKPYFENNTFFVLVNNFNTAVDQDLQIKPPRNEALLAALRACALLAEPVGPMCQTQLDQVLLLYETLDYALGDAALQFFERELNAALSGVLEDGINQLMFDRAKDGTPDPVINLNTLAKSLSEASGRPFDFNIEATYRASASDPIESVFLLDGGIFAGSFDECVNPGSEPAFRYTELEIDGNAGHDPPVFSPTLPGTALPYQLAMAFSDDFVNQAVYNMWAAGMLCVSITPSDPALPAELADLLVTDSFAPFVRWLPEIAPHAPVSLQVVPVKPPYVTFTNGDRNAELGIHLDDLLLSVFVEQGAGDTRLMRAFALSADVTATVEIQALNFTEAPLIDLNVKFDSAGQVAFNDLHPEGDEDLAKMLPAVLDAMAPSLAELVGNMQIPLLSNCLGGLRQRNLVLRSSGTDPVSGLDNYMTLYLNFDGTLDFNRIITECMEALPLPTAPRSPEGVVDAGLVTVNPAPLAVERAGIDPAADYRWRIDGGFWSPPQRGAWAPRRLLDGNHRVDFEQHGAVHSVRFFLDSAPPAIRTSMDGAELTVEAVDKSAASLRINGGAWQDESTVRMRLASGRHTIQIVARDKAGHESALTQTVTVHDTGAGCASNGPVPLLLALLIFGLFRLRNGRALSPQG